MRIYAVDYFLELIWCNTCKYINQSAIYLAALQKFFSKRHKNNNDKIIIFSAFYIFDYLARTVNDSFSRQNLEYNVQAVMNAWRLYALFRIHFWLPPINFQFLLLPLPRHTVFYDEYQLFLLTWGIQYFFFQFWFFRNLKKKSYRFSMDPYLAILTNTIYTIVDNYSPNRYCPGQCYF